jgi:hypothetical protein
MPTCAHIHNACVHGCMRVRESTQRVGYMFVFVSQTLTQTNSLRPTRRRMRITAALVANSAALQDVHHRGARSAFNPKDMPTQGNDTHSDQLAAGCASQQPSLQIVHHCKVIFLDRDVLEKSSSLENPDGLKCGEGAPWGPAGAG